MARFHCLYFSPRNATIISALFKPLRLLGHDLVAFLKFLRRCYLSGCGSPADLKKLKGAPSLLPSALMLHASYYESLQLIHIQFHSYDLLEPLYFNVPLLISIKLFNP